MRPCEMSRAELHALPVGPFIERERPLTAEDVAAGKQGRCVVEVEYPAVVAVAYTPQDLLGWIDDHDQRWSFGQWADGQWFKQAPSF